MLLIFKWEYLKNHKRKLHEISTPKECINNLKIEKKKLTPVRGSCYKKSGFTSRGRCNQKLESGELENSHTCSSY